MASETYKLGDASTPQGSVGLETKLQDALQHNPDIIYFAGYAPDVKILLQHLQPSDPPVMGGNALYQLDPYDDIPSAGKSHLRFTAVGYSDEWDFLCSQGLREACSKPSFFTSYSRTFDDGNHQDHPYGYSRANSGIMLAYDATMAFLKANEPFAKNKTVSTGSQMQQALAGLTEPNALQGVTGQLSFGSDGNSINKAVAIVCNKDGFFKLDVLLGQFIVNGSVWAEYPATSVCA